MTGADVATAGGGTGTNQEFPMSEESTKRQGLGRGLSALLGEDSEDYASLDRARSSKEVPIESLRPSPYQPRRRIDLAELESLVASVREKGILQPILVRRMDGDDSDADKFEIVAGERRWRAAQEAQLHRVPVVIKDLDDTETLEVALVENLQRQDLSPLEEAQGYSRLMEEFSHTQERLAQVIGKSRSHLANMLRLMALPDEVKDMLDDGRLTAGHGRAILAAKNQVAVARRIVKQGLSVRDSERIAQGSPGNAPRQKTAKNADTIALEKDISDTLGLPIDIRHKGERGGEVKIAYKTLEQLDEVCRRLAHAGN
jgi:ParB family chromosome partitioning protein